MPLVYPPPPIPLVSRRCRLHSSATCPILTPCPRLSQRVCLACASFAFVCSFLLVLALLLTGGAQLGGADIDAPESWFCDDERAFLAGVAAPPRAGDVGELSSFTQHGMGGVLMFSPTNVLRITKNRQIHHRFVKQACSMARLCIVSYRSCRLCGSYGSHPATRV